MTDIQTSDELTDKINAALEAEPDAEAQPQEEATPQAEPTPVEEAKSEETDQPDDSTPTAEPEPSSTDYRQKFVDSSRESILNAERIKVANEKLEKLTKTDTPTDEAMRELYSNWDELDQTSKSFYIKQEAQEMRQRKLESELSEFREEKRMKAEIEEAIEANPKLLGKESEFKRFAANPKNKGISAEVLAKAFLFDVEDETPAPVIEKTEGLPQGNGGSREPLKPSKISIEEAARIRQTDNNRYMELVKSGMIDDDIE